MVCNRKEKWGILFKLNNGFFIFFSLAVLASAKATWYKFIGILTK